MTENDTYLIRQIEVEDNAKAFEVVQAARLGQYYEKDSKDVERPYYAWALRVLFVKNTYKEASAIIEALMYSMDQWSPPQLKHPTFTGSVGGAGKYPLDKEGGSLLFTIVSK